MSEFKVKPQRVRSAAGDMNKIAKQMKDLEDQILKIRQGLSFEVAQKERISQRLKTVGNDTSDYCKRIYSASSTLNTVANTYEMTESRLAGLKVPQYEKYRDTLIDNINNILSLPPFLLLPAGPSLGIGFPGLCIPAGTLVDKLLDGNGIGYEKSEIKVNLGTISKKIKTDTDTNKQDKSTAKKEKTFESINNKNGELKQSDIKAFKTAQIKRKDTKSLYHGEEITGDKDGTHFGYQFDVLKREKSAECYTGLYYTDPSTGKKKLRAAAGFNMGYTLSAISAKVEEQYGNSMLGAYAKGEAAAGKVEAKCSGVVGFRDADGKINPTVHGKLSAEVLAGELSGKVGVKILGGDFGVKGSVNVGMGAHLEVGVKDGKFSLDAGAALGVGASVKLEIDVGGMVDTVCGTTKSVWNKFTGG